MTPASTFSLDGPWTLRAVSGPCPAGLLQREIPATVPGCVHLDLMAANEIPDPFDGTNEEALAWIGSTVWRYTRTFEIDEARLASAERHELVALGLDTLATVTINGAVVGLTENQNRSYRWSVGHLLRTGTNEIVITFDAPVPAAVRRSAENGGELFHVEKHPYNAIRKTSSNFGWDWGIDVATSGIWRSIGIESWSDARIDTVRPLTKLEGSLGVLTAHIKLAQHGLPNPHVVAATLARHGAVVARQTGQLTTNGSLTLAVPDVAPWWPRGYGEPTRYDLTIELLDAEGAPIDQWVSPVGFRTVEIDTAPDAYGNRFQLRVNGRDITVHGANWIPDDALVTRIDTARLERRVRDATEANMNLLRVWGGGMYESDEFYEICSREGVMVWQDFLLACAAYAEESWLADEIEAEAREAVTRLSKHASHILWCGTNENLVGYTDWGWRSSLEGRTWGEYYYTSLFPSIVAELDPACPYIPGSPFSAGPFLDTNRPSDGTVHIWDVWNEKDYTCYRDWNPRFVAEFGFQGPPAWTTLFDVVHDSPADPFGREMLVHQKANRGNLKLENGLKAHLPTPTTIDDWHFATQLNQAAALRFGISWFRSLAPSCTGTVIWQLNDDWPVVSWAAVDYAERRKPLWYALRDVYAPRLATFQPEPQVENGRGALTLVVLNDTDERVEGVVHLRRLTLTGEVRAEAELPLAIDPRSQTRLALPEPLLAIDDHTREILTAEAVTSDGSSVAGLARAIYDPTEVIDQALDPGALDAHVESTASGAVLTVTARSYVRDIVVLADRADASAHVDRALVSLLPGESTTFVLEADGPIPAERVLAPEVLRSANQLLGEPVGTPLETAPETAR